jgi:hypothetical protein
MNDMSDLKDEAAVTQENTNHDIEKYLQTNAQAQALTEV